jgi:GT2 family glycosyltransferase
VTVPPPGSAARRPTVSVVIAAYTMERWDDLRKAVESVRAQTIGVLETIVVVDHHPELLARARAGLPGVTVIPNAHGPGASGARNTGVAASHAEVVAFLDDDAVAAPSWLEALLGHFASPDVVGVGGRLDPLWDGTRPRWFPEEFDWAVGASYRGMPQDAGPVRNVWSNNMAIRRPAFDAIGGFRDGFGKVAERSRPEDTDLCLRAALAGGAWIYEPTGIAGHRVRRQRATVSYFLRRCFNEGWGKAALAALNGTGRSMSTEREYTRRVLPSAMARGIREAVSGDVWGASRSLAIATGLLFAAAGFVAGHSALAVQAAGPGRRRQIT